MRGRRILAAILAIAQVATCSSIVQAAEIASSLSATSVPTAQYYVTVPESIDLGEISTEKETTTKYGIDVEIVDGVGGSVKIESSNVMLNNSKKEGETFVAYNSLEKVQVSKSTEVEGIWTVYPDDVKGISAGQYEGTANFVITYSRETIEEDKEEDKEEDTEDNNDNKPSEDVTVVLPQEDSNQKPPTIENEDVLNELVDGNDNIKELYFVMDSIDEKNPGNSSGLEGYYPEDYLGNSEDRNSNGIDEITSSVASGDNAQNRMLKFYTINIISANQDGEKSLITDLESKVLEIAIPIGDLEIEEGNTIGVARKHESEINIFKALAARSSKDHEDGTYYVDLQEGMVYIYSSKFSVYALYEIADTNTDTDENTNQDTEQEQDGLVDGTYTAQVSMRKEMKFEEASMCDSLFAREVDMQISRDEATITMYVIDPIPNFASEGTPLKDVSFAYDGEVYEAEINTEDSVNRYFDADGTFISTSGNYSTSKIVVTLPVAAIEASANQELTCEAYVNAIMKTDVIFFVVFSELLGGETETPEGDTVPLPDKDDTTSTIPPVVPDSGNTDSGNSGSGSTGSGSTGSGSTGSGSTSSGSTSSGSTSSSSTSLSDGKYMADVSMRKETDFTSASMCDALFANQVDITVSGSSALLTMYVIDPIPNYAADGTPLTNISFTYNGKAYSGSLNSSNQELRYFDTASGFIDVAGYYYTSKITVTLPVAALENTGNKTLICNAFVNVVMKTDVEFYILLGNFVSGETTETTGAAPDAGEVFSVLDSMEMELLDLSLEEELNDDSDTLNSNGGTNHTGTSSMISNLNELADFVSDSKAIRVIFMITMALVAGIAGYSGYIYYRRKKADEEADI